MLSISSLAQRDAGYYLREVQESYYLGESLETQSPSDGTSLSLSQGTEPPGYWLGGSTPALNLLGQKVEPKAFQRVLDGYHPSSSQHPLVQNPVGAGATNSPRQPGWDLTFSAPKAVSTYWALSDASTRAIIEQAHRSAVSDTLQFLEEEATFTRRGKEGKRIEPSKLLVACFEHGSSREKDPALHTHALVINISVREDKTTGTLLSKPFYQHKMAAGALYRAQLAHNLTQELGVVIEPRRHAFGIQGVPLSLEEAFSTRSHQLRAHMVAHGTTSARAAEISALETRRSKQDSPTLTRQQLREQWHKIGERLGFDRDQVPHRQSLEQLSSKPSLTPTRFVERETGWLSPREAEMTPQEKLRAKTIPALGPGTEQQLAVPSQVRVNPLWQESQIDTLVTSALEPYKSQSAFGPRSTPMVTATLLQERGSVTQEQLLQTLAQDAVLSHTGGTIQSVREATKRLLEAPELVALGPDAQGRSRYALASTLEAEQQLLQGAQKLQGRRDHAISDGLLQDAINATERHLLGSNILKDGWLSPLQEGRPRLSEEQKEALKVITQESGDISILSGVAGSGKSALLYAAREAWESRGYTVIGAALAGKAAVGLEESSKIPSTTVERLLMDLDSSSQDHWLHHGNQLLRAAQGKPTYDWKPRTINENTILVVDEISMIGTHDLNRLIQHVVQGGGKLVTSGDNRQLPAIESGAPARLLEERLGGVQLYDIRRQALDRSDPTPTWRRDTVQALADGRVTEALENLAQRDKLTFWESPENAKSALLRSWSRDTATPDKKLILTATREEARQLNEAVQAQLKEQGKLGWRSSRLYGGQWVSEKERLLFTENHHGYGIRNGDLGTLRKIDHWNKTLEVKLDRGETVLLPLRHKNIELGYAVTTHRAQGLTVENAYILINEQMPNREMLYVQASRARQETRLFAPSAHNEKSVSRLGELFSKSSERDMALDIESKSPRQKLSEKSSGESRKSEESHKQEQEPEREMARQRDQGYGY